MSSKRIILVMLFSLILITGFISRECCADDFKIGIMQDKAGAAEKYKPLLTYLKEKGIEGKFVTAKDYPMAAKMFAAGHLDAMFSGSGVAGTMIIKEVATPLVRPLSSSNTSTYWALVIAKKGSPKFTGTSDYFKDKKVTFCSLASSGEFYFHSIEGSTDVGATLIKAKSHGAAISSISKGFADVAVVKNRVWDKEADKFDDIEVVGKDDGENPDNTLIVSKKADAGTVKKVSKILMGLQDDSSDNAKAVKDSMSIKGFIKTTGDDFKHTIALLEKAGVTKDFGFKY